MGSRKTLGTVTLPDGQVLTLTDDLRWRGNVADGSVNRAEQITRETPASPQHGNLVLRVLDEVASQLGGSVRVNHRLIAPDRADVIY